MIKLFLSIILFLSCASCVDDYSSKMSAERWGKKCDKVFTSAVWVCRNSIHTNQELHFVKSVFSAADDLPYAGVVFKVVDNNKKVCGYMLYAKDTTSGQDVCRVVIYEKTKEDFNAYCRQTPFYMFAVE